MKQSWLVSVLVIFVLGSIPVHAFDYKKMIADNPAMVSGEYYRYIFHPTKMTPAPKGYKPFYISHYGRHGSRYHSSDAYMDVGLKPLLKGDSLGILTSEGKSLKADLLKLKAIHKDHQAMLTELGIDEQQSIAQRMSQRFPEVFENGERDSFVCLSSNYPRCLASMGNFITSLQHSAKGKLIGRMYCGDDVQRIVGASVDFSPYMAKEKPMEDSLRKLYCNPEPFIQRLFTDTAKAHKLIDDPYQWMKYTVNAGSIVYNLPQNCKAPTLMHYFTTEELQGLWLARNARFYYLFSMSKNCPEASHVLGDAVVRDIVCQADKAVVRKSHCAANFRFGHDSVILPSASIIELEGLAGRYDARNVENLWNCTESICMASNLQIVFYRNNKDDILVKFLYNETERHIPALKAVESYYYKWSDVRPYLLSVVMPEN